MKAVISTSLVVFVTLSWQTTSSQHAPNSAWASDSFLQDGNLPTHQQSSRSPAVGSSQGINQLPNGQVFKGMGWVDGEGSVSHLKTVSNIHSPEECMDECASNRKSNHQGCVAFTFVESIQRCDLKSQTNAQSLKQQDSHHVMSAKCTSGCGRTGEDCAEFEVKVFFQASKENSPRTEAEVMKTGGSYTRDGNFADLVWKKKSENRFIFNSAGWKIGLHDHIGQNGGGFFKGKQNLPSNEEETWTSMSSRCPFCKVTVRCKNALPIAPPPIAPRPITPRRTTQRPTTQRPIAPSTVQCSSTEFTCVNPRKCIPASYICDGDYDCEDNSDETNCAVPLPDNLPHKCQRIRIRKDAHRLTEVEKNQLQHAMNGIIQDGTFQEIANYHGAPYGEKCELQYTRSGNKMGCCKHRGEGASAEDFWSWHRLYMVQLEEAMEKYLKGTDLGLPYWDWTNNAEVPDVWADIYPEIKSLWSNARRRVVSDDYKNTNHIYVLTYNPSMCHNPNRNDFSIIARIWPNQAEISASTLFGFIDDAMNEKHFEAFTAKADNAHAAIHNELNCSMTSPGTTAYDPTFWMHHTFLDKVLADRQANEFYEVPHFNNDRRRILEPFGNSRVNPYELTKITNNETLDHYNNLCYCYDSLENCAKTSNNNPFEVSKLVSKVFAYEQCVDVPRTIQLPNGTFDVINEPKCETRYDTTYEEINEKISKLSVSVGFVIPKGFGGVGIPYKACYPKFVELGTPELPLCEDGKLYLFGGSKDVTSDTQVNSENYDIRTSFLFTREITSLTKEDETFRWDSLELLDYKSSLPIDAPLFVVVQITNGDKDYTFAQLQQGVKKQGYGNLLDDYNDVKDYGYSFQLSTFVNK